jgi:Mg2+-importing ATPase
MEQNYSTISTLSTEEANLKLLKDGPNTIPLHIGDLISMSIKNLRTPIILIDLSILVISLILGANFEALLISIIIAFQFLLSIVEINLLGKYLFKRDQLNPPIYKVIRGDNPKQVKLMELVQDDLLILKSGDMVPADCVIIKSENLSVDESLFSGSSFPVIKVPPKIIKRPKEANRLYAHSYVVSGNALVRIIKTGPRVKYVNHISNKLYQKQLSELDIKANRSLNLIMLFMLLTILISILILLIIGFQFEDLTILLITSLIISTIPTLFPLLSSLSLLKIVVAMNNQGLMTLDLNAFEKLAQIDLLCFDKSGTLTSNELEVIDYDTPLQEEQFLLKLNESSVGSEEPFDKAIQKMLQTKKVDFKRDLEFKDKPFDPYLKNSSRRFNSYTIIKGSPEQVLSDLQINYNLDLALKIKTRSQAGERIISLIEARGNNVKYLGTIFFKDEIKLGVKEKLLNAKELGLETIMISGDNLNTCAFIGIKGGIIESTEEAIEASQLQFDSPKILKSQLQKYKVIARANPVDKYKILEALENDHNLAFIGEGINDIASLKISHIAIVNDQSNELIKRFSDILVDKKDVGLILNSIYSMRGLIISLRKYIEIACISGFSLLFSTFLLLIISKNLPINPSQILFLEIIFLLSGLQFISSIKTKGIPYVPNNFGIREKKYLFLSLIFISLVIDIILYFLFKDRGTIYFQNLWFIIIGVKNIIGIAILSSSSQKITSTIPKILRTAILIGIIILFVFFISPRYLDFTVPNELYVIALIWGFAYAIVLLLIRKLFNSITKN